MWSTAAYIQSFLEKVVLVWKCSGSIWCLAFMPSTKMATWVMFAYERHQTGYQQQQEENRLRSDRQREKEVLVAHCRRWNGKLVACSSKWHGRRWWLHLFLPNIGQTYGEQTRLKGKNSGMIVMLYKLSSLINKKELLKQVCTWAIHSLK